MNGARTDMAPIAVLHNLILLVLPVGLSACIVVAAGYSTPVTAVQPPATATSPAVATTTSGSALFSPSNTILSNNYLKQNILFNRN